MSRPRLGAAALVLAAGALVTAWVVRPLAMLGPDWAGPLPNLVLGAVVAVVGVVLAEALRAAEPRAVGFALAGAAAGSFVGASAGRLLPGAVAPFAELLCLWLGGVLGARAARARARDGAAPDGSARGSATLLDTSALVDGRLAEVAEAGFLPGTLVVPPFVLRELRGLADASDPGKRARGRRGLDVLERLRGAVGPALTFPSDDLPEVREVDVKLAELARRAGARVLTLDANLRKVAAARGVSTASLTDLARALRAPAHAGDVVVVEILKEGREPGQGIGYLEDGTMVVVEEGAETLGRTVEVVLTNLHQSSAGRMFFGRLRDGAR